MIENGLLMISPGIRRQSNRAVIKLIYAFLFVIAFLPAQGFAQKKPKRIDILKSDKLIGGVIDGHKVRKLLGHVELQSKDLTIHCDSAYQYLDSDLLRAFGNIEIDTKKEKIWSDLATYDTKTDKSDFTGRVIVHNNKATLFSANALYSYKNGIAHFPNKIRLEDKRGTLIADSGIYYNKKDSAIFRGNVQVADSTQYAEADSLFSNRATKYYELHGKVFISDAKNHVKLAGDFIKSDSTGYRLLRGHSYMEKIGKDKKDTSFVWSDDIKYWQHDSTYVFHATGDVHIWSKKFSSISDTAIYRDSTSTFTLISNAKAWYKRLQLTGPKIIINLKKDTVRSLISYPKPFIVAEDSVTKRLNQITGDTVHAKFRKGDISSILVYPQGQILYFSKNSQNKPDGAIQMTADSVLILFNKGNVKRLIALKNVDGNYLEESKSLASQKLKGFEWDPKLRPTKPVNDLKARLPAVTHSRPFPLPYRYKNYLKTVRDTTETKPLRPQHFP